MSNVGLLVHIRCAHVEDAEALAQLAWAAKASWGYSQAQLEGWREGLSPTASSISGQPTFIAEVGQRLAGFCQLNLQVRPPELEHLWVHPHFMRRGVGRALLAQCRHQLAGRGVEFLHIDSDPNAELFYVACGAVRVGEVAAPIEGQLGRARPQLRLSTSNVTLSSSGQCQATPEPAVHVKR
jgi:GNAT superfamily N-acetyltransferase